MSHQGEMSHFEEDFSDNRADSYPESLAQQMIGKSCGIIDRIDECSFHFREDKGGCQATEQQLE